MSKQFKKENNLQAKQPRKNTSYKAIKSGTSQLQEIKKIRGDHCKRNTFLTVNSTKPTYQKISTEECSSNNIKLLVLKFMTVFMCLTTLTVYICALEGVRDPFKLSKIFITILQYIRSDEIILKLFL